MQNLNEDNNKSRRKFSITRLRFLLVAFAISFSLAGCQQFVIISYLLHGPPSIEPDFDAETGESMSIPDVTVAVVCFAPTELKWKFPQLDEQVATHVSFRLGQNHITMIHPDYVKAWIDEHPDWEKAEEIGEAFKADYVIEIELADFSLHEGTSTTLFRGRTEAYVHVVKIDEDGYADRIFTKEVDFSFPTRVPRSSYDQSQTAFQKEYLSRLSEKIGWMFYDRFHGDMIGWAN
ncbi:MAG: hypothetical protein HON04_14535 [Planctomicrobium sp.]|jgi:hypothetical protein|nr:hypothetical protein [Planctomicrobium sp.]